MEGTQVSQTPLKRSKSAANLSDVSGELSTKRFNTDLFDSPPIVIDLPETQLPSSATHLPQPQVEIDIPDEAPGWAKQTFAQIIFSLTSFEQTFSYYENLVKGAADVHSDLGSQLNEVKSTLQNKLNSMGSKISILSEENRQLRDRLQRLDKQAKRDNLLVLNVPEERGEFDSDCLRKFRSILYNIGFPYPGHIRIVKCHRKGKYDSRSYARPRPILVRFHWTGDRDEIWHRRTYLQGSGFFFAEDFPEPIEKSRKVLWPAYKKAQANKNKYKFVEMVEDKLVIDNKSYTIQNMHTLPTDLNLANKAEKTDSVTVAFFGMQSPLSNHHPAPFKVENVKYNCSEQFLMKEKAELFGEEEIAHKIMVSKDPVEQKRLGKSVERSPKYSDHVWHNQAPKIVEKALQAKFFQNPSLGFWLLGTEDKTLVEATPDKFWGIGFGLRHKHVLSSTMWDTEAVNCMGKALMQTREWLKRKVTPSNITPIPINNSTPVK